MPITVSANPQEYGTVSGGGTYSLGEQVIVSATAHYGYQFKNWTENGVIVSQTPSGDYSFIATGARDLVANFVPAKYGVAIITNPYAGGTASGNGLYNHGENVTVSAIANPGYEFVNWTEYGEVVSTSPEYVFEITKPRSLYANFKEKKGIEVVVSINMPGGKVLGGGTYNYGDEVTVEAIPNCGYKFVNWAEGRAIISTDNPYSFTVTESMFLLANFEEVEMVIVETIDADGIKVYPNPATGELKVECGTLRVDGIEVFDMSGKKLLHLVPMTTNLIAVNISDFPAGVYFINLQTEHGTFTKRFVKD